MADGFFRCQLNRVLVAAGTPEVSPVGGTDGKVVAGAHVAAMFVDSHPGMGGVKKFSTYNAVKKFIATPTVENFEAAEAALLVLFYVAGELEGVLNECGEMDVRIDGVFPVPEPVGVDLAPRGDAPEPPAGSSGSGPEIPLPDGSRGGKVYLYSAVAGLLGVLIGVWWRRRSAGVGDRAEHGADRQRRKELRS